MQMSLIKNTWSLCESHRRQVETRLISERLIGRLPKPLLKGSLIVIHYNIQYRRLDGAGYLYKLIESIKGNEIHQTSLQKIFIQQSFL